jgi:hypothetical protein
MKDRLIGEVVDLQSKPAVVGDERVGQMPWEVLIESHRVLSMVTLQRNRSGPHRDE